MMDHLQFQFLVQETVKVFVISNKFWISGRSCSKNDDIDASNVEDSQYFTSFSSDVHLTLVDLPTYRGFLCNTDVWLTKVEFNIKCLRALCVNEQKSF